MTHDDPYSQRESDAADEDLRQRRADEADEAFNERRQLGMCNTAFWDRPADERAARMEAACARGGVADFFDLPPDERWTAYCGGDDGYDLGD